MDGDLKTLLHEKADEVRLDPRIPDVVVRRSRRRRMATATLAGAVTAAVAVGFVVVARLGLTETPGPDARVQPGGSEERPQGAYPFIYPASREELENIRAEVRQGSMPLWTDPRGTATLFAVNVLGWDVEDVEVDVRGDDPITAVVTNPTLSVAAGASGDIRTQVFLVELPDPRAPMYVVLGAMAESLELEPIGPDEEFGLGDTLGFQGRVLDAPDGVSVVLRVEGAGAAAAAAMTPDPTGRFELEVETPADMGTLSNLSVSLVDRSGVTLALTAGGAGLTGGGESQSGASGPVSADPIPALPRAVEATRRAIVDAAHAFDWGALRALIPAQGFTFSFGGDTDPIAYWQRLESESHVPVIGDILPLVLSTDPGRVRGGFIWPAQATDDPAEWDEQDLDALRQLHNNQEIRSFQRLGIYLGWRVEIARDGTWLSFVAGD